MPLSNESTVGSDLPVLGLSMENIGVPLHKILVESDLVSGEGERPGFLIKEVAFLMGNDLAGGKVLVTPEVMPVLVRLQMSSLRSFPGFLQLVLLLDL